MLTHNFFYACFIFYFLDNIRQSMVYTMWRTFSFLVCFFRSCLMKSAMNHVRLDLEFEPCQDHLPDAFLKADIKKHGKRHIILATDQLLEHLSKAKSWYIDGTFKLVKQPAAAALHHQRICAHRWSRQTSSTCVHIDVWKKKERLSQGT